MTKTPKSVVLEEIAKRTHKSLRTIQRWAKAGRISGASRSPEGGHWTVNIACFNLAGVLPKGYHDKCEMLNKRRLSYEINFVLRGITEDDFNTPRDSLKERDPEKYDYIYRTTLPDHKRTADLLELGVLRAKFAKLKLNKPDFTLDDLARELGISKRTLYHRCRSSSWKWKAYNLKELRKIWPIRRKRAPLIEDGKLHNFS